MPADRIHMVRHGEVLNPQRLLYGRLPEFGLSERGHQMAAAAAEHLVQREAKITRLVSSPLQRARESALPLERSFGLQTEIEPRIIEPWNVFEGLPIPPRALLKRPDLVRHLWNPARPSWGEPYREIAVRMRAAVTEAAESTVSGELVMVSHQLPIWVLYLDSLSRQLPHMPRNRRCDLSSVTSFELAGSGLVPIDYAVPHRELASLK
jgi:broad specificity phosphatase PhoE